MMSHPKWRSTNRLVENNHFLSVYSISRSVFISRRALAQEGDYKTPPVCACVR